MNKKSILKKTILFGLFTFLSRFLALPREILQIKFLGVGALSDAFIAAFRLPNFFRRIFADGALSAAFIPSYVQLAKKKKSTVADGTMTISFIFFEGIVLLMCLMVFIYPNIVLALVTPGFSTEQINFAVPLLKILFPFLFFVSSSALLSGALQAKNHFFAQSFGPVLHNIVYLATLIFCLIYRKDALTLSYGILASGLAIFILHIILYFKYKFSFAAISDEAILEFKKILKKFIPCLIGVGIVEINLYLDNIISSFLAKGSYTLLYSANRFMNLPLGVFAVAFSTILLPHFSRITTYAPKRLHFYLLETAKFITWMITPAMLFLIFTAHAIFTNLLPDQARVAEATAILICYSTGLLFYCLNKVLINMFYSLHDTWSPTFASILATIANLIFNLIGMYFFGSAGIAAATAISGLILTITSLFLLYKKHNFTLYWQQYLTFVAKYFIQLTIGLLIFFSLHIGICYLLAKTTWYTFFCIKWGYFIFTIPLFLFTMMFLFLTKGVCKLNVYFLNK